MAVIGTLRNKAGVLIVGVIALSIVGFLVMDITNSQTGVLSSRKTNLGEVNGDPISINEFNDRFEESVKNMQDRMGAQGQVTDDMRNQLRTQAWDDLVKDKINRVLFDKLGLAVTDEEMVDLYIGTEPHPYIRQSFTNPATGQFDPNQVTQFLKVKDKDEPGMEPGFRARIWESLKREIHKDQLQQKYNRLVTKGLYAPTWMSEQAYTNGNSFVSFRYVMMGADNITDDQVKLTDADLQQYLDDHVAMFKAEEETRRIQFVAFPIVASSRDSAKVVSYLIDKMDEFTKGSGRESDSAFVRLYSEDRFDEVYYTAEKLASVVKDSLTRLAVGATFGPYVEAGKFKVARLTDRKMISDSVRVSEIFFNFAGLKEAEARKKYTFIMDTVFKALDSLKQDFGAAAAALSEDPVAKNVRGDIGWVKQGQKDAFYNNLIFYRAKPGKPYIVSDQQGVRIIQVTEERPSSTGYLFTYFTKAILPGAETERAIYSTASRFAGDNQKPAAFKEKGKAINIQTGDFLRKNDYGFMGMQNAREVVRWAYQAKVGDVSPVISADGKYIVALLDAVVEKGKPSLEGVREMVQREAMRAKKLDMQYKKMADVKASTIDELASKLGLVVSQADRLNLENAMLPSGAFEPNAVALAMQTAPGKLSPIAKGRTQVIAVSTISVEKAPKAADLNVYATTTAQRLQQQFQNLIPVVLRKSADIEDNRFEMLGN